MHISRRHNDQQGNSYWPGYVDALVNVVLNMMFLVAILAAGSFTVGMEGMRKQLMGGTGGGRKTQASAEKNPGGRFPGAGRPGFDQAGGAVRAANLGVRFNGSTMSIDDNAREGLKEELKRQVDQGVNHWMVSVDVDIEDRTQRRAAYFRMISIRNVFLEAGIAPAMFDMRMYPGEAGGSGNQVVRIVPERQPSAGNKPAPTLKERAETSLPQPEPREQG
jgi:hypothetical protein